LNILLADDHTLFRDSLKIVLKMTFPDSKVTAVGNWHEARGSAQAEYFDLLLLDLIMPGADDGQWEPELAGLMAAPYGAACIISASDNRAHIRTAFKLGVSGYICKTFPLEQTQHALRMVSSGVNYLPEQLFWDPPKTERLPGDTGKKITWRQREVLELLAAGNCNKNIARKLKLSESTIKRHAYNLYRTLGAKNRTDAIRIGRQQGLLGY
jgi:DNA-binding NarL/FixJ family response regulator